MKNSNHILPARTKEEKMAAIFGSSASAKKKAVKPAVAARTKAQKLAAIRQGTTTSSSTTTSTSTPVDQHGAKNKVLQQREKLRLAQEWAIQHGTAASNSSTSAAAATTAKNHAKKMKSPQEIKLEQREKLRRAQDWAKKDEQQRAAGRAGVPSKVQYYDHPNHEGLLVSSSFRRDTNFPTTPPRPSASTGVGVSTPSHQTQRVLRSMPTSAPLVEGRSHALSAPAPRVYVIRGTIIECEEYQSISS
jgi:hypothetical protein